MDFILWILSWFESPIFVILFLISIPASIIFMIVTFRNIYRKSEKEKNDYEEFKSLKKYREQFYDSVNRRRKNNE
ncbi:hypothetical protein ACFGOO_04900 [Treponema vincentii]|uniref:hypothetical protein n=1 Tax=Treponema vincentii TaxID=69710 RepID=UPI0035F5E2DE